MSEQNPLDQGPCGQAWRRGGAEQAGPPRGPDAQSAPQWEACIDVDSDPRWAVMLFWGWVAFSVFAIFFLAVMFVLGIW